MIKSKIDIGGLTFVCTCDSCPEQYEIFNRDEKHVAYARLQWGEFSVSCPDVDGSIVYYSEDMRGDGQFEDNERQRFLADAAVAIHEHYQIEEGGK